MNEIVHAREARKAAIDLLSSVAEGHDKVRFVLLDDLHGLLRIIAWAAEPGWLGEVDARLKALIGPYWAGEPYVASKGTHSNSLIYERAWELGTPLRENLRVTERLRAHYGWFGPVADPLWSGAPHLVGFYSFKGGVGRTTALSAFAASRALCGERVAVVDLDLDAPGISYLLGDEGDPQTTGVADFLVDRPMIAPLSDYYRVKRFTGEGVGEIAVFGTGKVDADYLSVLGRVQQEPSEVQGVDFPVTRLFQEIRAEYEPTWILVDCRAGFSEAAALVTSGLLHLTVLLGTRSSQTWDGLQIVVDRLGRQRLLEKKPQADCLVVQTLIPEQPDLFELFREEFQARVDKIFSDSFYLENEAGSPEKADSFWTVEDAESGDAPSAVIPLTYNLGLVQVRKVDDVLPIVTSSHDYLTLYERIADRFLTAKH